MQTSLALKDSTNLWNQNSSVDIINVKLCLRPQKQVLNPWSILILRSTNDLINIWNQPKNLKIELCVTFNSKSKQIIVKIVAT